MMAIFLPVVILLAAISINIAYLELNRTEMVIASDRVLNDFKVGISPQRFVHYQQENDK